MEEHIYDNKNARLIALLKAMLGVPFMSFIVFFRSLLSKRSLSVRSVLILLAAMFAIFLLLGLYNALKIKKIRIEVGKDTVDITRGKAHGVYLIDDFIRGSRDISYNAGRGYKTTKSLVFKGDGGEELFIDCDGFSDRKFANLSDDIELRKISRLIRDEDNEGPRLYDGKYQGDSENPFESRSFKIINVFMIGAAVLAVAVAAFFLMYAEFDVASVILLVCVGLGLLSSAVFLISVSVMSKRRDLKIVNSINMGQFDLEIDDRRIGYHVIRKINMTNPYLKDTAGKKDRIMQIISGESSEPEEFYISARPQKEPDPKDPYIALYNSIRDLCKEKEIDFI